MSTLNPRPEVAEPAYPARRPRRPSRPSRLLKAGAVAAALVSLGGCAASPGRDVRLGGAQVVTVADPVAQDGDGDGVSDSQDLCPSDAEDADAFDDQDGCPDPDNDQDRILDANDQCPNDAEVYNGTEDDDGCPDQAVVVVRNAGIVVTPSLYFTPGSAQIRDVSVPILDSVVAVLRDNPDITLVEVLGHAADPGPAARDLAVSQRRAAAVFDYLTAHGVDAQRLRAVGYGSRCPMAPGDDERNRRVEFFIVRRASAAADETPSCTGGVAVPR
jgi:outer membrane protein OmpA-like peptidoglycan-associated protein